jgi:ketosteroid isomerase-like protein
VIGYFGRLLASSDGTLRPVVAATARSDEGAVLVLRTTAQRAELALDASEVLLFHVHGGSITEVFQIAFDQYAWDEFWRATGER